MALIQGQTTLSSAWISELHANRTLDLPWGPVKKLTSPDGSYILYGVPYQSGITSGPQLWIEDARKKTRKKLLSIGGTLRAAWSPDSAAFYVVDRLASDSTLSYIYEMPTLKRLDIAEHIFNADQEANRFARGHVYVEAEGWTDKKTVQVHFHGHTDESEIACFDFRYLVNRTGVVTRLSRHITAVTSQGCFALPGQNTN